MTGVLFGEGGRNFHELYDLNVTYPDIMTENDLIHLAYFYNIVNSDEHCKHSKIERIQIDHAALMMMYLFKNAVDRCSYTDEFGMKFLNPTMQYQIVKQEERGIEFVYYIFPHRDGILMERKLDNALNIISNLEITPVQKMNSEILTIPSTDINRRFWFSFLVWLRFVRENLRLHWVLYSDFLLDSKDTKKYKMFQSIRVLPFFALSHSLVLEFWRCMLGRSQVQDFITGELLFFLDNVHSYFEEIQNVVIDFANSSDQLYLATAIPDTLDLYTQNNIDGIDLNSFIARPGWWKVVDNIQTPTGSRPPSGDEAPKKKKTIRKRRRDIDDGCSEVRQQLRL